MTGPVALPVYTVRADADTAEWLGEPERTDETCTRHEWDNGRTDCAHVTHDTYEPFGSNDKREIRLLRILWVAPSRNPGLERLAREARDAIAFRDKVRAATEAEQIAVGTDAARWIEGIVERLAASAPPEKRHD